MAQRAAALTKARCRGVQFGSADHVRAVVPVCLRRIYWEVDPSDWAVVRRFLDSRNHDPDHFVLDDHDCSRVLRRPAKGDLRSLSFPADREVGLVGRIVADLCNLLLVSGVIVAIGYVIGFRYKAGVLPALGSIVLTMGIGIAFCFLSVMFAATLKNVEAVQTSGFMLIFPLTFLSNVFVPVQTLEYQWLRTIAQHNPVSRVTDAFRACAFGGETARPVMIAIAWILGLTVGFAALAVRQYRKL